MELFSDYSEFLGIFVQRCENADSPTPDFSRAFSATSDGRGSGIPVPVRVSEGTSRTQRSGPCAAQEGQGVFRLMTRALQAFMHHAYFTDKHDNERPPWEFQEYFRGVPSLLPQTSDTDSRQLKDRDKHPQVWWGEVSLSHSIPGSLSSDRVARWLP